MAKSDNCNQFNGENGLFNFQYLVQLMIRCADRQSLANYSVYIFFYLICLSDNRFVIFVMGLDIRKGKNIC